MVILVATVIDQNLDLREPTQYHGCIDGREYLLELDQTFGTKVDYAKNLIIGQIGKFNPEEELPPGSTVGYRSKSKEDDPRAQTIEVRYREDNILSTDFYGRSSGYVHARVIFEDIAENKGAVCEKSKDYTEFADKVLDHYLQVIRYLTNTNAVSPYDRRSIPGYRIYAALDDPTARLLESPTLSSCLNTVEPRFKSQNEPYFICWNHEEIDKFLDNGQNIPIDMQLLLEAKSLAFDHSSYDMAIILIETSFEVFLATHLKNSFAKKNIKRLKKPGKNIRNVDYAKAIDESNVNVLLTTYEKQIYGIKLNEGNEYAYWKSRCLEVRNSIIHRGAIGHKASDAEDCFNSMTHYRNYLVGYV